MLPLAVTLLALSLLLLILALRGRTIARGRFCRKCKFDLAGLASAATPACPECGRSLDSPKAVRDTLRQRRVVLAWIALVIGLVGFSVSLSFAPAVQAWVLPRAPDRALVWLHRGDMPGANLEVIKRLGDAQADRSALQPIIERDLSFVLATTVGTAAASERLRAALTGARLTPSQAHRLFEQALRLEVALRESVAPDALTVPTAVMLRQDLPGVLGLTDYVPGFQPLYQFDLSFGTQQAGEHAPIQTQSGRLMLIRNSTGWHGQPLDLSPEQRDDLRAGRSVSLTIHARVVITDTRSGHPVATLTHQHEQQVRSTADPHTAVRVINDPGALERLAARLRVHAPGFTGYDSSPPAPGRMLLNGDISIDSPQEQHIVYAVTIVGPRGVRIDVPERVIVPNDDEGFHGRGVELIFLDIPTQEHESHDDLYARWADAQTIDIILTPDPAEAYRHPMIGSILDGQIIFKDVPLQRPTADGRMPTPNQRTWVTGKALLPVATP